MASKNLGAVIQRAISDGAFRRQLQSDPAAALRGFNLTPNEIAAIRSGDASKLTALGVDQRVSKAFTVGGGFLGATRSATSDMGTGAMSNGIIGDPTSGARDALTSGNLSGTRAVNDVAPFEGNVNATIDPTVSGTRAIHDDAPADLRSAATTGGADATRAIHDDAPADLRAAASTGDLSGTRAVHDSPPFEGNVNAAASGATGDPYSGQYIGVSPDFQARLGQAVPGSTGTSAIEDPNAPEFGRGLTVSGSDTSGPGGNMIAADDNYAVSSRMADSAADATRAVHDVAPFDSGTNTVASGGNEFIGGDIQHDPGDVAKTFIPSDSADVQREMLDGLHDGGALGNTGTGTGTANEISS